MIYQVPYGQGFLEFELEVPVEKLEIDKSRDVPDPNQLVKEALQNPIGSPKLSEIAQGKKSAVIVINDVTRPSPSQLLVEAISGELNKAGIDDSGITLLVATGNHRPCTEQELIKMLGEKVYSRFSIINHNAYDEEQLIHVGYTTRGLDITVNRLVVESDLTILTGIITPHQSAGFSGGRKSMLPGVAGIRSIEQHHSLPHRAEYPVMGIYENNPFHEGSLEAARKVGVDFIVNVVKYSDGRIASVVAGDLVEAHEKGIQDCKKVWAMQVQGQFDITIVSPGGFPKDFDLHQAQKALALGEMVTKRGGSIILVAECADGIGKYAQLMMNSRDPQEVIECFKREGFKGENQASKAFMFARALQTHTIYVITDQIDLADLKKMFFIPSRTINDAYTNAKVRCQSEPRVGLIPYAVDCLLEII
ncbi:nickel-dependent lactate racemase [Ammoniphilus resinae]|uniref:Nickel-dependent lactate racemase n=1 Tax=Ammoniphilus resinae TaxID=861532 RepID=A0ABS4GKR9_9BACL|nr:nickel-dependent lactate racemase [Ammoniphilus resinae]MBP1930843.1 nickel-dependent lactate racemase [Ammoniphilus resinae]